MCPITKAQIKKRKNYIGSSDIPALLGESPYNTAYDVWAEKCGLLVDEDRTETPAMLLGNCLEEGVIRRAVVDLGPLLRNQFRVCPGTKIGVNIDALRKQTGEPIEIKIANAFRSGQFWGEEGTDQVPNYTICQCHGHMLATGKDLCWVPALVNGDYALYVIKLNKDLVEVILAKAEDFWKCVENKTPPEAQPSLDVVRRLVRTPKKMVNIDDELVAKLVEARKAASVAKKAKDEATANVLAKMGDAEAGLTAGLGAVTYYNEHRSGYSVAEKDCRILRYKPKGL